MQDFVTGENKQQRFGGGELYSKLGKFREDKTQIQVYPSNLKGVQAKTKHNLESLRLKLNLQEQK